MDQSGAAVAQVADEAVSSQELMITRIENTMAGMVESDPSLQNDPRYQQMEYLKQKVQGRVYIRLSINLLYRSTGYS
jgi:hypothetical protein